MSSMSGNRTPAAGRRAGWLPWQARSTLSTHVMKCMLRISALEPRSHPQNMCDLCILSGTTSDVCVTSGWPPSGAHGRGSAGASGLVVLSGRSSRHLCAQADCKGKCWVQEAGANAASAGDESDEGGPGEGSSAGATSYGECTSAEHVSDGSGGSSGHGGSGGDEPQVQVRSWRALGARLASQ